MPATSSERQKRYRQKQKQQGKKLFRRYVTAPTAIALQAVATALEKEQRPDD